MNCANCNYTFKGFVETCPNCGMAIDYGENTRFYIDTAKANVSIISLFSETLKKRRPGDIDKVFRRSPTSYSEMLYMWQKPWLYIRVFAVMALIAVLLAYMSGYIFNTVISFASFIPANFIICLIIPLTILFFLWETDMPRTVALYEVFILLLLGGTLSMIIGLYANTLINSDQAYTAAFTEEPAKLIVALLFIGLRKKRYYILDGLVIGTAIAAGFAFMETSGYSVIFYDFTSVNSLQLVISRSLNPIGGHILYTAPCVGALCWAMDRSPLKPMNLLDIRFILFLLLGMLLHAFHNTGISLLLGNIGLISIYSIVESIIGWATIFFLVKRGLRQAVCTPWENHVDVPLPRKAAVIGLTGAWVGKSMPLAPLVPMSIGRSGSCNLIIPKDTVSVSRHHCELRCENGRIILRDLNSTHGTYLANGKKLAPQTDTVLSSGDRFYLSDKSNMFEVRL